MAGVIPEPITEPFTWESFIKYGTRAEIVADPPERGEMACTTDTDETCSVDKDGNLRWICNGNQIPAGSAGCCMSCTGPDPRDLKWIKGCSGVFPNGEGQTLVIEDGVVTAIN